MRGCGCRSRTVGKRSEEHTSELQSRLHLVCRLMLEPSSTVVYPLSLLDALPILAMFALLVRRWTSRRQWLSLADWARERRLKLQARDLSTLPPPLTELQRIDARLRLQVTDGREKIGRAHV